MSIKDMTGPARFVQEACGNPADQRVHDETDEELNSPSVLYVLTPTANAIAGMGARVYNGNDAQIAITGCSMQVIQAAVSLCVLRSSNRNAFDEFQTTSVGSIITLAGMTAGIASLARASGKETTLVTGAATAAGLLGQGFKSPSSQSATQSPATAVIAAGLQYLSIDELLSQPLSSYSAIGHDPYGDPNGQTMEILNDNNQNIDFWRKAAAAARTDTDRQYYTNIAESHVRAYENSYAHLFDAAIFACSVAGQ